MSKYHSRKTAVDGIVFDSAKEARRYVELKLLERAGKIRDLKLQPEFVLQPGFRKNGKTYRQIAYKADFSYFSVEEYKIIIEDVKGLKTPVYCLKRKLYEYKYPDSEIREV